MTFFFQTKTIGVKYQKHPGSSKLYNGSEWYPRSPTRRKVSI